jgi:hypothetical protein
MAKECLNKRNIQGGFGGSERLPNMESHRGGQWDQFKMRRKILLATVVSLLVGAVYSLWFLPGKGIQNRTTESMLACHHVLLGIDVLDDPDTFEQSLERVSGSLGLNRAIGARLRATKDYESLFNGLVAPDGVIYDAWGTPLNFFKTNDVLVSRLSPRLRDRAGRILVWSSGPNRKNEDGYGDDVFY